MCCVSAIASHNGIYVCACVCVCACWLPHALRLTASALWCERSLVSRSYSLFLVRRVCECVAKSKQTQIHVYESVWCVSVLCDRVDDYENYDDDLCTYIVGQINISITQKQHTNLVCCLVLLNSIAVWLLHMRHISGVV